jgi:hypothetical protein
VVIKRGTDSSADRLFRDAADSGDVTGQSTIIPTTIYGANYVMTTPHAGHVRIGQYGTSSEMRIQQCHAGWGLLSGEQRAAFLATEAAERVREWTGELA